MYSSFYQFCSAKNKELINFNLNSSPLTFNREMFNEESEDVLIRL